jgi:hypothetical protein
MPLQFALRLLHAKVPQARGRSAQPDSLPTNEVKSHSSPISTLDEVLNLLEAHRYVNLPVRRSANSVYRISVSETCVLHCRDCEPFVFPTSSQIASKDRTFVWSRMDSS